MRNIKIELIINKKEKTKMIFEAKEELLVTGFKLNYIAPESLENYILKAYRSEDKNKQKYKSDCLEENLTHIQREFKLKRDHQLLSVSWR